MSENEKRLRELLASARPWSSEGASRLDALLSAARDAALEDVKRALKSDGRPALVVVDSLKSQPARRYLDAEEVQRMLHRIAHAPSSKARAAKARMLERGARTKIGYKVAELLGLDIGAALSGCPGCGTDLDAAPEPKP